MAQPSLLELAVELLYLCH